MNKLYLIVESRFLKGLLVLFAIIFSNVHQSNAQLNPLSSIYYQNQYLANPAMAGMEEGISLSFGLRQQWSGIPGGPRTQSFTGEWGFNNRVGTGIVFYNDQAGLLQRTRLMGTYAYHLPVGSGNEKINFGISLGVMSEFIDHQDVDGDQGDASVGDFNQRETYMDGDFGLAYTSGRFSVQGAIPNMKNYFNRDIHENTVDRSTFYSALSYKFNVSRENGIQVEPKLAYRGVKGHSNIIDAGANLTYANNAINLMGIWHSSQSATFGLGMNYKNIFAFSGMYTTETGMLSEYSNGDFEMAIKVFLFKSSN